MYQSTYSHHSGPRPAVLTSFKTKLNIAQKVFLKYIFTFTWIRRLFLLIKIHIIIYYPKTMFLVQCLTFKTTHKIFSNMEI